MALPLVKNKYPEFKQTQLSGKHALLPHAVSGNMVRYDQKLHCSLHKNPQ